MVIDPTFARQKTPMALTASLSLVAKSHSLRCDAKQAENRFAELADFLSSVEHFTLGDFLPHSLVKGIQPAYIESLEPEGVPVISTVVIQQLTIRTELCRFITYEDYKSINEERKPRKNDVLLTVDGGTSIGKPVLFALDEDYAIDSHVVILRPVGIDPKILVYLLTSPIGQTQFQQAESGASGQTSVTEADIRRFRFPILAEKELKSIAGALDLERVAIAKLAAEHKEKEEKAWDAFNKSILAKARRRSSSKS